MTDLIPAWEGGVLRPVEKLDVHRRGLRHKAVSVFVISEGRVLMQQRALTKYHTPGLWANTCCTHPHWNEDPAVCARRRLAEELGVTGLDLMPRGQIEYRADVGGGLIEHELADIFVTESAQAPRVRPNPDEVNSVEWAPIDGLPAQIDTDPGRYTPWIKIYLRRYFEQIFGASAVPAE